MARDRDDFPGSALDSGRWTSDAGAGAAVSVASSMLTLVGGTGGALAARRSPVDITKSQTFQFLFRRRAGATGNGGMIRLIDTAGGGLPTLALANAGLNRRIDCAHCSVVSVPRMRARYRSSADQLLSWSEPDETWKTSAINEFFDLINNNWYEVLLEIDGSADAFFVAGGGFRISITGRGISGTTWSADQGLKWFTQTTWVPFSSLDTPQSNLYVCIQADANETLDAEYFSHSYGGTVWLAENTKPGAYVCELARAHDVTGPYQHVNRTSIALIPRGAAGSYDDAETRNPRGIIGSDGIWRTFYTGFDGSQSHFCLARHAAGNSPRGAITKHANNPLINGVTFFDVWEDVVEANPARRWKGVFSAGTNLRFGFAPADGGPWTLVATPILTPGPSGTWDQNIGYPKFRIHRSVGYLFYAGWRTGVASHAIGCATTADLSQLTGMMKYGGNPLVASVAAQASLTAALNGNTATVNTSSGFNKGDHVVIARAGQPGSDDVYSRVRSVPSGTSIELYHAIKGGPSGAIIVGYQQGNRYPRNLAQVNGRWYLTGASLNHDLGSSTHSANQESTALWSHSGAGPLDAAFVLDRFGTPLLYGRDNQSEGSNENESWYEGPVTTYGGVTGAGASTLPAVTSAGAGTVVAGGGKTVTGDGASMLPAVTSAGAGTVGGDGGRTVTGDATSTLPAVTSAGAGTVVAGGGEAVTGDGASMLPAFLSSGTGMRRET